MPSNLQAYRQIADHAALQITGSHESWMAFLKTAARLYKYPYNEQIMIHAQCPNATACAEYDFWNERMGRYVRRGSKGIAVIDTTGDNPKLKYVFDVADTGTRENSRSVSLWELRPEHTDAVSAMLERSYDVSGEHGLQDQLERVAAQLADEYWNEHSRDMLDILEDSFLEEYDDFNVGVQFRNAATVSITYALMARCGLEPDDYFEHEDFLSVFDFNTPVTVNALGTAVSEINQQVLRQIEITIRNYERAHSAERTDENGRTDLCQERRLPDSRPEPDRAAGDPAGQVWQDAENVPEGASPYTLESPDPLGGAVPASEGDRRDGEPALRADDAGSDEPERSDGEPKSQRPDEMGGLDEQSESTGGGNDSRGVDLQLNEPPAAGSVQLSFFPTEGEQIAYIDEAESVAQTPFAFSFAQEDIDHVLRLGGNNDNSRQRVAARSKMSYAINSVNLKLRGVGSKRTRLYEDFADGILNEEEYQFAKSTYDEQGEMLNRQLDELVQRRNSYAETLSSDNKWISLIKGLQETSILTKELADMAIDHIVIYEDGSIELFMKYHDVFVLTGEYLQEICGEESA